ncbi:hypothetical protein [Mycolicibacterium komossense]|uniref:Uncharacterized protein n=1 Tax=Mycolicibacterium komossense TaxID=1779 RepID=A0ABT3CEL8_9MYCO|nr:hypothetical protein [Mycolicibacterium komossense]MCV7227686.1 hypothetical protein [Mycolicibacterium komossense]
MGEQATENLSKVRENLKAGKLDAKDLKVLEHLVERTEAATSQLRAAIVE